MLETRTELANWKREWSERFGFMAEKNESASIESIDEVASILSAEVEALRNPDEVIIQSGKIWAPIGTY